MPSPKPTMSDSAAVMATLLAYDWPGNVRELENTCERIAESCVCGHVRLGCLGASLLFPPSIDAPSPVALPAIATNAPAPTARADEADTASAAGVPLDEYLRRVEARLISEALATSRGNKSRAARILGVKRSTLGDRIARCGAVGA